MKFTKDHEWIKIEQNVATIGITKFAAEALGELVYVELPKIGASFKEHAPFAVVESSKSASDVYMPIEGEIIAINEKLSSNPELVNNSPLEEGWIVQVKFNETPNLDNFMDESQYNNFIKNQ